MWKIRGVFSYVWKRDQVGSAVMVGVGMLVVFVTAGGIEREGGKHLS